MFYFSCFLFIIFVRYISRALVLCRNSPHSSTCLMTTQFKIMLIENTTLYTQSDNDSLLLASLPSLFCRYCCSCSFCSFHFLVNFFLTCLRFSFYVDTFCPRRMMSKHAMWDRSMRRCFLFHFIKKNKMKKEAEFPLDSLWHVHATIVCWNALR